VDRDGAVGTVFAGVALFGEALKPVRLAGIGPVSAGIGVLKLEAG